MTAIKNGTSYTGAGQFDGQHRTFLVQPQGQLSKAEDYENLIVSQNNGAPVYLKDIAKANDSVQDERINMRFWLRGQQVPSATVVVAVFRRAGSNAVEVAKEVRAAVPSIRATLPGSVALIPIYDRSQTIVNSVEDVKATLGIAFVLVVMVIFLFLGRATDTLIPAIALPLSLLLTFMAMNILGYSLDNLSLMALTLAIGFLVDDAIVFLENTVRLMETGQGALEATLNSAREISFTILAMTISLAAVFIPLVFMTGLVGRIFREFAITIIVSIFASGIVSLTLTPLMCSRLLGRRGAGAKKTWMERVTGGIERRVLKVYGEIAVVFPSASLGFGIDLGNLPGWDRIPFLHRSQGVLARRRQLLCPRGIRGARGLVAGADAPVSVAGGRGAACQSGRGHDLHHVRKQRFLSFEPGLAAGDSERSRQAAADPGRFRPVHGGDQLQGAGTADLPAAEPGAGDQHGRDGGPAGAIRLFTLRHRSRPGVCRRPNN